MENKIKIQEQKEIIGKVLLQVREALVYFKSAKRWGFFDMFFGGVLTSIIKRNKIQKGNYICEQIRVNIKKLNSEIENVEYKDDFYIGDGFWDNFWDIFADNFFADLMIQDKLENLITRLEVFESRLEKAYNRLNKKD